MAELPGIHSSRKPQAGAEHGAAAGRRGKQAPHPKGLAAWWPLIAGVALDFVVPQITAHLAPYEPWGTRAVFPLSQIFALRELGFSNELTQALPQLMLYLQFPLEALLTGFRLRRGSKPGAAIGQLVFLHALCLLVMG
jgi:hypothetical protein